MIALDFFYLNRVFRQTLPLACVLIALPAIAAPPSPADFTQASPLVLTLSEDSLMDEANQASQSAASHTPRLINPKSAPTDSNIGCRMDVNPDVNQDTAFTSRVEGKCNFNYRY